MDVVLVARTTADPMTVSSSLRGLIHDMDPELALPAFRTMDDVVTDSFGQRRFQMALVLLFAAAGTLLASLGIYGVVSYSVAQRTNELGIRLALGALPGDIRRLVISQGSRRFSLDSAPACSLRSGSVAYCVPCCSGLRRPIRSH